jgi:polygalacturonase
MPIFFMQTEISAEDLILNIQEFGAIGDGKSINTNAIQTAIDRAHTEGGGKVYFPSGQWMTGKIFLKSNVELDISPKAILLAAPGPIYGEPEGSIPSLIYGNQLENITITGGGVIEGKTGIIRDRGKGFGRRLIGLERCKNVKISNLTITHGGGCTLLLHSLDSLEIGHVKVLSFYDYDPEGGEGKDGVNLDGCSNVWIHDCEFRGSDDAFAFKARRSGFRTNSENIKLERCIFASRTSNAIQYELAC